MKILHKVTGAILLEIEGDFVRANLREALLSGANLSGANMYGANLIGSNLSRANLSRANLIGANLHGADMSEAKYDKRTQFPVDFCPEGHGIIYDEIDDYDDLAD